MLSNCDIGGFRFMKTGFFKKAAAVFMAGAMAVSLAGCADDSWSAKDDTQTLAAGVYIYNLYSAYQEAQSRVRCV